MPKLSDNQQNSENQKVLPDVVGAKKQVSYKTEIIGGVPIVTQTQVNISLNMGMDFMKDSDKFRINKHDQPQHTSMI